MRWSWLLTILRRMKMREYAVKATVMIYVGARSADDAADEAWDRILYAGFTPVDVDLGELTP